MFSELDSFIEPNGQFSPLLSHHAYQQKVTESPLFAFDSPQIHASPFINTSPLAKTELGFGAELDLFWSQLNCDDSIPYLFGNSPQPTMSNMQFNKSLLNDSIDFSNLLSDPSFDDSEFDLLVMDMQDKAVDPAIYKNQAAPSLLSPPKSSQQSYLSPNTSYLQQPQFKYTQPHPYTKLTHLLKNPPSNPVRINHDALQCTYANCNKRFTMPRTLALHMQSHSDERAHVCEECSCRFKRLPDLQRHMRSMHTVGDGCFVCPEGCGKSFPRSDALKRHLAVKGKGSKFGCEMLSRL